ncbi:PAS domain-containing hybrid sensor histidine kinase/response regulator [Citreicella sp. C3M06]|uniref:PAS domain-containing hybrid sensor histidine kinase/response regulator n=1 Tax=Citreicella sp. C3M06 TaxID=2841564 RepID=UPI0020901AFB|nr:PAS domain-containing hybrid sensor histidine kinase/response regulator [Citreicella sp. C3M06]
MIQLIQARAAKLKAWTRTWVFLIVLGGLCSAAIAYLVAETVRELRYLHSARSDNVHWVMSQAEVENLDFRNAVDLARIEPSSARLTQVGVRFDVFYSRMVTLGTASLYGDLRDIDGFGGPVAEIRARLDQLIPLIDGDRAALRAGFTDLSREAGEMRFLLRQATTAGLHFFAERSDQSRESFALTLMQLALFSVALLLALAFLLQRTLRIGAQSQLRGQELAQAYARLNVILETSLDAVVVCDLDGRILNFNSAAERIFDHAVADVLGKKIADILVPDHLRAAHDAGMTRMREHGEHRVSGAGRVRLEAKRRNGEVFPVEMALETAQAGEDQVFVAFLRDISRRVAGENELVEARDKALAGEKAKADFLAMMTHEIRTPLNGLLGNLALIGKTTLTPVQERYVRNMDISGKLLMHHVDAVLDVARFETGASMVREEVVHLGNLVRDIVHSQSSAAEANGNLMQWDWVGEAIEWVRLDGSRLQQVLVNLLGNAIKFTRDGHIQIEIEQTRESETDWLEFRVIDSGIGISDDDQLRIFGDFQTVDDAATLGSGGTGLGLGIARRFAEAMGGSIGVESEPGGGSVFWVKVPLVPADPPQSADQPPRAAQELPGQDVLLVEDNEINLELARALLVSLGHRVTEARYGEDAVAIASTHRFDLILMDIRMPRLDGLGATVAIRSGQGASRDVPIIALSANVLPEARVRFTEAGMSGFLPKPLTEADLRQALQRFAAATPHAQGAPASDPKAQLVARYARETGEFFDWLATGPEDMAEIANRAHQIAGSAAAFGQMDLRGVLARLEIHANAGDRAATVAAMAEARAVWKVAPDPVLG